MLQRNEFEDQGWILRKVRDFGCLCDFDCGLKDLTEFFQNDCQIQRDELLSETFELVEATMAANNYPVALVSLCNDSIRKEAVWKNLNFQNPKKEYPAYPAVKIARLGVRSHLQRNDIGTQVLNMIKTMFITDNRTGCRFITVDAHNEPTVISFYKKRGDFQFFSNKDEGKKQRAMFFDLKRFKLSQKAA